MAGFAVHVDCILSKPNVWMGFDKSGKTSVNGFLESDFLENFSSRETVECRGNNREVCECVVATSHDSGVPGYHQTDYEYTVIIRSPLGQCSLAAIEVAAFQKVATAK